MGPNETLHLCAAPELQGGGRGGCHAYRHTKDHALSHVCG